jgi:transcription elongation factor GreA-like protein
MDWNDVKRKKSEMLQNILRDLDDVERELFVWLLKRERAYQHSRATQIDADLRDEVVKRIQEANDAVD